MNADRKSKTLFVNGKEVSPFDLTGDETKDMAAAKRLLAEQDMADADARRHDQPPSGVERYGSNGMPT
jgi:hypothetical protein